MARQISLSDEVYEKLLKIKGKRSFSEVIKEELGKEEQKGKNVLKFAGILKRKMSKKEIASWEKEITEDREKNYGRALNW